MRYFSGTSDTSDICDTSDTSNTAISSDASKTSASVTRLSSYFETTTFDKVDPIEYSRIAKKDCHNKKHRMKMKTRVYLSIYNDNIVLI